MDQASALGALAALAQEKRLDAFRLLVKAGPDGLAAGEIAAALETPRNTLSSHLSVLTHAGLIRRVREGRIIRYRSDYEQMQNLVLYLLEDCCQRDTAPPLLDAMSC